jgi:hypothetical protein
LYAGFGILKTMCLMASGGRPVRGDLFVRWPREAKNEILEVFEEAHEYKAQQGPNPFQGTCSHSVEDYQRVSDSYCGYLPQKYPTLVYNRYVFWTNNGRCIRVSMTTFVTT